MLARVFTKHVFAQPISNFESFATPGYNVTRNLKMKFTLTLFNV